MSDLRIDRIVHREAHRHLREFLLYGQPGPDTAVALAVAEPAPPDRPDAAELLGFAAGGFRDMTRSASG